MVDLRSESLGQYATVCTLHWTPHSVRGALRGLKQGHNNFTIFKKTTPCKRVALQLSSSTQQTKTWLLSVNELDRFQAGDSDIFQIIDRIGIDHAKIWFNHVKIGQDRVGAGGG